MKTFLEKVGILSLFIFGFMFFGSIAGDNYSYTGKDFYIFENGTISALNYGGTNAIVINKATLAVTIGSTDGAPSTKLNVGEILFVAHGSEATKPASGNCIEYNKGNFHIWRFNNGGANAYFYFDYTATSSQSVLYSATEP